MAGGRMGAGDWIRAATPCGPRRQRWRGAADHRRHRAARRINDAARKPAKTRPRIRLSSTTPGQFAITVGALGLADTGCAGLAAATAKLQTDARGLGVSAPLPGRLGLH